MVFYNLRVVPLTPHPVKSGDILGVVLPLFCRDIGNRDYRSLALTHIPKLPSSHIFLAKGWRFQLS